LLSAALFRYFLSDAEIRHAAILSPLRLAADEHAVSCHYFQRRSPLLAPPFSHIDAATLVFAADDITPLLSL
jgi:hypothetical protein